MASYESLADASLAAALNMKRFVAGLTKNLDDYDYFTSLLEKPLTKDEGYKLLYDARKLPIYRRAWKDVFGASKASKPSEELLREISDFLQKWKGSELAGGLKNQQEANAIIDFCLSLNRLFLEGNANLLEKSHRSSVAHGAF